MGAKSRFRKSVTGEPPVLSGSSDGYGSVLVAAALAALIVAWAAVNLWSGGEGFALLVPDRVVGGEEAASALARLFAALVLGLFLADAVGWRARWVALGLVVLGMGHLVFGYLEPTIQADPPELNESLYEAFVTQTLACALFAVGLYPGRPSRLLVWIATVIPIALVAGYVVLFEFLDAEEWMPALSRVANPEKTPALRLAPDLAHPVALGALRAAAGARGGGGGLGLLAASSWVVAGLVALRRGASRRVGLARLPLAFGLRGRPAHHRGRAQSDLRRSCRDRRHLRAQARRLRARDAVGHRARTRRGA